MNTVRGNVIFLKMFHLLIAVVCLASLTQAAPQLQTYSVPMFDGRIIGGEPTFIEDHPYQASLQFFPKEYHKCGAVVISENYVLTAAHCTDGYIAYELAVRAGSTFKNSGGVVIQVAAIYQNPYYDSYLLDYDISVLRLVSSLSFGSTIAPVALPEFNQPIIPGSVSQISGWGQLTESGITTPTQLQVVEVPIVSLEECSAANGAEFITDRMVCAGIPEGGKDACKGDSGGPLVVNGTLIGLVSWSWGCARPGYPGVYSSVPALRNYITYVTGF